MREQKYSASTSYLDESLQIDRADSTKEKKKRLSLFFFSFELSAQSVSALARYANISDDLNPLQKFHIDNFVFNFQLRDTRGKKKRSKKRNEC